MAGRIFWGAVAGLAIIGGIAWQDGGIISWDDHDGSSAWTEHESESVVQQAIDSSIDKMEVTGADGKEIDVPPEAKKALAEAIGRMVEAQADLVVLKVRDASAEEIQAATARRDEARADVDRLKEVIKKQEAASAVEGQQLREQIQQEVREDVREAVREAVRN